MPEGYSVGDEHPHGSMESTSQVAHRLQQACIESLDNIRVEIIRHTHDPELCEEIAQDLSEISGRIDAVVAKVRSRD